MGERPDEPGQPDGGHQGAGSVGRLVAPDGESAVEVREPDREMQQTGAWGLAVLEAERLGGDRHDRAESADGEAEAAAMHGSHSDTRNPGGIRVDPEIASGSGLTTAGRASEIVRERPG